MGRLIRLTVVVGMLVSAGCAAQSRDASSEVDRGASPAERKQGQGKNPPRPSVDQALRQVRRVVDVRVVFPSVLRRSVNVHKVYMDPGRGSAQLSLRSDGGDIIILTYGVAEFDGCGGDRAEEVTIGRADGLLLTSVGAKWIQVIWPATKDWMRGTYGVAGSLSQREALALARLMSHEAAPTARRPSGC